MTSTDPDVATAVAEVRDQLPALALPALPPSRTNMPTTEVVEPAQPTRAERLAMAARAPAPVKPAVRTTEFWLVALGAAGLTVAAFVMFLTDTITQSAFVTIVVAAGVCGPVVWAVLRTLLKIAAPTVVVPPGGRL